MSGFASFYSLTDPTTHGLAHSYVFGIPRFFLIIIGTKLIRWFCNIWPASTKDSTSSFGNNFAGYPAEHNLNNFYRVALRSNIPTENHGCLLREEELRVLIGLHCLIQIDFCKKKKKNVIKIYISASELKKLKIFVFDHHLF